MATVLDTKLLTALDTKLLTAEEFHNLDDGGVYCDLVRGKIVKKTRPYPSHGYFVANIACHLQRFVQLHDVGRVGGAGAGIITGRDPDTVRGPDVTFYSYQRIPRGPLPQGYWPAAPELVIEVLSAHDQWKDVVHEVEEYLTAGVLTVAIADPEGIKVHVFSTNRIAEVLNADEDLAFVDTLPGFTVLVKDLFE